MNALSVLVDHQTRQEACAVYTADCLGALVNAFYRTHGADDFEMTLFSEIGKPKPKPKTAAEIKQDILNKLNRFDPVIPEGGFKGR